MTPPVGVNKYINNHYEGMTPEQLILMLYKGALHRLDLARQGIKEKNIQKRGENLSKAIAIISELNCSLNQEMTDETTQFLRGLYTAILTELPKASLNNDEQIIIRAEKYISRLKEIWETNVMGMGNATAKPLETSIPDKQFKLGKTTTSAYPAQGNQKRLHAFAV